MVDSVSSLGGSVQALSSSNKTDKSEDSKNAKTQNEGRVIEDSVEISQEALDAAQAEQAATDVRSALENDTNTTLGSDTSVLQDI